MVAEVPGYTLHEPLGRSSDATVWRGEAVGSPGRVLAIKVVPGAMSRAARDVLHRRTEILGELSDPGILRVVAIVPTGEGLALVMPYAAGGSLAAALAHERGGLPPRVVTDIGLRLASALAAIHRAGIVHGDIKPSNVLFDGEGQPLLADAGITRLLGEAATSGATAGYLAPESIDGGEPDAHSDLYALGVTLYEALAGAPPYTGTTAAEILASAEHGRFVPLAARVEAPPSLTAVIEAAFARDLRDRPDGASALVTELDEIRRTIAEDDPAPDPLPSGGRAGVLGTVPRPARPTARRRIRGFLASPSPDRSPSNPEQSSNPDRSPSVTERSTPNPERSTPNPNRFPRWDRRTGAAGVVGDGPPAPRRVPRLLLVTAAVVLVPIGIVTTSIVGGAADGADTADEKEDVVRLGTDGPPAGVDPLTTPRETVPLCEGLQAPDDGREILFADVEAVGCSAVIAWDGRRMEVLSAAGSAERYDLGAQADDVLRFGDWSCDGRDAPALYRPVDGRLFTFDAIADPGDRISVAGLPTGVTDGVPTVVTDADGCDRIEVAPS